VGQAGAKSGREVVLDLFRSAALMAWSFQSTWTKQRRHCGPAFHRSILKRMYRSSVVVRAAMNRSKSILRMTISSSGRLFRSVRIACARSASGRHPEWRVVDEVIGCFRGYCLGMSTLRPTPLATLMMLHLALVAWNLWRFGKGFHTLPDAYGSFLNQVFRRPGCLHLDTHQRVEFGLELGFLSPAVLSLLKSPPSNAKRATPENSGIALSAWLVVVFLWSQGYRNARQPLKLRLGIARQCCYALYRFTFFLWTGPYNNVNRIWC